MIPALPAVGVLLIAIKAAYLAPGLVEQGTLPLIGMLLWNDLPALGVIVLFSTLPSFIRPAGFRAAVSLAAVAVVIFNFVDVVLVVTLNARISVRELGEYAMEGLVSTGMIWLAFAIAAIALLLTASPRCLLRKRSVFIITAAGVLLSFTPPIGPRWISRNYGTAILGRDDPLLIGSERKAEPRPRAAGEQRFPKPPVDELVIVMVESLTAADSLRTSGVRDILPEFDELSRKGTLFTNYFANHQLTEGGLVSLLIGRPPVVSSGTSTSLYTRFKGCRSVPAELKGGGYSLSFISSGPIVFRGSDSFIRRVGFDLRELGREPQFRDLRTASFWDVPDHVLFAEALKALGKLQAQGAPYLLFLETDSTHRPYTHPLGLPDTEEEIWRYLDQSLARFVRELEATGFLSRGQLIIVGDHRKMVPIPMDEFARFGESSAWRVPLLVLGKGIPAGKLDPRLLQASDLFRFLPALSNAHAELSAHAILVRRYFPPLFRENRQSLVVVDRELNQFGAALHGGKVRWESRKPVDWTVAEAQIKEAASFSDGCR